MRATMTGAATVAALALAAACGSSRSGPPCDVRAERLENVMRILSVQQTQVLIRPQGMKTLDLPEGRAVGERGLALEVRPGGDVRLQGMDLGKDRDRLREQLDTQGDFTVRTSSIVYVLADAETTLGTLDGVLAAVPEDYELRLVGYGKPLELDVYQQQLRDKPRAKKFDAQMTSDDPSGNRAAALAREMQTTIGHSCAPLVAAFGGVAGDSSEDKASYMAREVPDALRKCHCDIDDPDMFEYLMYRLYGAWDPPAKWIPLARQHGLAEATVADLAR